ncbi:MAG: hypothetical protein KAS23_07495 [Anaerohalosphaera sp.]|nr:hypothetical protein [Anaerohalosphaera sp.]
MHQQKREKHSTRFWLIISAVIITPIAMLMLYKMSCQSEFDRRVEALRVEGFPVSLDDLEKTYTLPEDTENAADTYIEAFSHYQEPTEEQIDLLPHSGKYRPKDGDPPFPKEVIDTIESFLQQNQKTLDLLEQAAKVEYCLWPRIRNEIWLNNEYLGGIKDAIKLLCEQNLYLAQAGDTDKLFNSMQTSIALIKTLSKQASLYNNLVAVSLKALCVLNLQDVMNRVSFTEEQLTLLQKQFAEMHNINAFHDSLIGERCSIIEFWKLPPAEQKEYSMQPKSIQLLYSLSGLKQKDALLCLDYFEKYINAAKLPLHERCEVFTEIDHDFRFGQLLELHLYLYNMVPFTMTKMNRVDLLVNGDLKCAKTALAIERYRRKHQTIPNSLEALVPHFITEVPRDPFDNKPLRYIKLDNGFTIYSIGDDGIDNGGISRDQARKMSDKKLPFDWPFTVKWK